MDEVIARVKGHRDTLLSGSESEISEALEALQALGSLPEQVLAETFVGLVVDRISKDSQIPARLKVLSKELVGFWQENLQKWRSTSTTSPATLNGEHRERLRERSPEHGDVAAIPHLTKPRARVVEKLAEALSSAASRLQGSASSSELPELWKPSLLLAAEIEAVLHSQLDGRKCVSQARSLLYNIKDSSNPDFGRSLLEGDLNIHQLACLSAEGMASSSQNARRAQVRKEAFEAAAVKPASHAVTDKFVCEKCGGNRTAFTQNAAVESCVRSGGEPVETMVTFVTCLACSHAWTERSGFA